LASLERKKIDQEYRQVLKTIKSLERLLRSPQKMRQLVADELLQVKETYADPRRTRIVRLKKGEEKISRLTTSDLVPTTRVWVMVSKEGLIARTREDKRPRLSGRHAPVVLGRMMSTDTVYLVAEDGRAAAIAVHALPVAEKPSAGRPISKVTSFPSNSPPVALFSLPAKGEQLPKGFVVTITRGGMVKKTALEELPGPSAHLFRLVKVNPNDRLGWVRLSQGKDDLLLATAQGMAIRFSEDDVRPMGLVAAGVMGIKLRVGDEVVGAVVLKKRGEVFFQAADGTAKRVSPAQFPRQGRYGQGVVAWKLAPGIRLVGMAFGAPSQLITLHLAKLAPKMVRLDAAPRRTRAAGGKRTLELKPGDRVIGLTTPIDLTGGRRR
jgi:DNA gyrase subunit A